MQVVQLIGQGWHVKSTALNVLMGQFRTHVKLEPALIAANPVGINVFLIK